MTKAENPISTEIEPQHLILEADNTGNTEEPNPLEESMYTDIDEEAEDKEDRGGVDDKESTSLPTLQPSPHTQPLTEQIAASQP